MKSPYAPIAGLVAFTPLILAEDAPAAGWPDIGARLEKRVYRNGDGESIPYRLFVPRDHDPAKKYPMVLFLHGAGERGDDNERQLNNPQVLRLVTDEVQAEHPCFLVAPQCPEGRKWVEVPWEFDEPHETPEEPSVPLRLTMELLDALEREYPIDPDRRYVTGLSMGGFGVFDLVVRRPRDFAAAVPICGGADDSRAAEIAHVAYWIFHGDADPAVPVVRSRSIVAALEEAGGDPKYTEYRGVGHHSWVPAYNEPGLVEWLFRQRR